MSNPTPIRVFVSCSRHDIAWLDRMRVQLMPLVRREVIELRDGTRIPPGADWRAEIERMLEAIDVAVCMVSADFLATDSIAGHELPLLLDHAAARGVSVLSLIVGPCMYSEHEGLSRYRPVNAPERPLRAMEHHEAEETLLRLAQVLATSSRLPHPSPAPARGAGDEGGFEQRSAAERGPFPDREDVGRGALGPFERREDTTSWNVRIGGPRDQARQSISFNEFNDGATMVTTEAAIRPTSGGRIARFAGFLRTLFGNERGIPSPQANRTE
jgi:hypothetical protein